MRIPQCDEILLLSIIKMDDVVTFRLPKIVVEIFRGYCNILPRNITARITKTERRWGNVLDWIYTYDKDYGSPAFEGELEEDILTIFRPLHVSLNRRRSHRRQRRRRREKTSQRCARGTFKLIEALGNYEFGKEGRGDERGSPGDAARRVWKKIPADRDKG